MARVWGLVTLGLTASSLWGLAWSGSAADVASHDTGGKVSGNSASCPSMVQKATFIQPSLLDEVDAEVAGNVDTANEVESLADLVLAAGGNSKVKEEAAKVMAEGDSIVALAGDHSRVADVLDEAESLLTPEDAANAGFELTAADLDILNDASGVAGHVVPLEESKQGAFQGDMMPASEAQNASFIELSARASSGKSFGAGKPWPGGIVKYCFAPGTTQEVLNAIGKAMAQYRKAVPCIQWKDVGYAGNSKCKQSPAVLVTSSAAGCWSYVGVVESFPAQQLNLGRGCEFVGTAIHELGHTIGMAHEQSRPDRDRYVAIQWGKIPKDQAHNFAVSPNGDTNRAYDILSVMHYESHAFSVDGSPTILAKPAAYQKYTRDPKQYPKYKLGNRIGLSQSDADQVADLYKQVVRGCTASRLQADTICTEKKDNGKVWKDQYGRGCKEYKEMELNRHIISCSDYISRTFCCECGGGWRLRKWSSGPPPEVRPEKLVPGQIYAFYNPRQDHFMRMNSNAGVEKQPRPGSQLPHDWTWERFTVVDAGNKQIALHNRGHNRFLRMTKEGKVDASEKTNVNALPNSWVWERFTVVDAGNGQIALHNKAHNRFIRMTDTGVDASTPRNANDLPTKWKAERFTPVRG